MKSLILFLAIASLATAAEVSVTWDDNSTDEQGFIIERHPNATGVLAFGEIGRVGRDIEAFTDLSAQVGAMSQYRVRAFNGSLLSDYSAIASISLPAARPAAPTNTKVKLVATVSLAAGGAITVKNSTNRTRPGSKTHNVPAGSALLVVASK